MLWWAFSPTCAVAPAIWTCRPAFSTAALQAFWCALLLPLSGSHAAERKGEISTCMALSTGLGQHTSQALTCQARLGMLDTDVLDAKRPAGDHGHSQPGAQDLAATFAGGSVEVTFY